MATARAIITEALRKVKIIGVTETPESAIAVRVLGMFNDELSILNTQSGGAYVDERIEFNLVPNQDLYTIGSGGDIDQQRPEQMKTAKVLVGDTWYPMDFQGNWTYDNSIRSDETASYPYYYRYRADFPLGELEFYPKPSGSFLVELTYRKNLSDVTLDTEISLPTGYEAYFKYKLAELIAKDNNLDERKWTKEATRIWDNIEQVNSDIPELNTDLPLRSRRRKADINGGF